MKNNLNNKWNHFRYLIQKSLEDSLNPEEINFLRECLLANTEARQYYINYMIVHGSLFLISDELSTGISDQSASAFNKALLDLSEHEKTAPGLEIEKPKGEQVQAEPIQIKKTPRKINKFSLYTAVISTAALIFLILFVQFAPRPMGFEVATLTDSINAKWNNNDTQLKNGSHILTSYKPLLLEKGLAEFLFFNNARIVIEAPTKFQVLTSDQIKLFYGRVYAMVPQEAIGFAVNTPSAQIIDLGTEFGVEADSNGDTYLHVIKGKTILIAGTKTKRNSMEIGKGIAKKISAVSSVVSDIPCDEKLFVRAFDANRKLIWRGQTKLDLADIVGGGNGFGTGTGDIGINPISGNPSKVITNNNIAATNEYHPVPSNPYIDGVFIPNGRTKQIISSQGHIFQECPISSGNWYISLVNTMRKIPDPQTTQNRPASEALYAPCIVQHANIGITYDLQAIRSLLPDINIVRFQSKFGIGKETDRPCNADFWILVDGELRYKKTQVKEKKLFSVDIELSEKDRFLTLVTTDGQNPEGRLFDDFGVTTIDSDWCRFSDPVLVLE